MGDRMTPRERAAALYEKLFGHKPFLAEDNVTIADIVTTIEADRRARQYACKKLLTDDETIEAMAQYICADREGEHWWATVIKDQPDEPGQDCRNYYRREARVALAALRKRWSIE
jgi:glutathione S-transferase